MEMLLRVIKGNGILAYMTSITMVMYIMEGRTDEK